VVSVCSLQAPAQLAAQQGVRAVQIGPRRKPVEIPQGGQPLGGHPIDDEIFYGGKI